MWDNWRSDSPWKPYLIRRYRAETRLVVRTTNQTEWPLIALQFTWKSKKLSEILFTHLQPVSHPSDHPLIVVMYVELEEASVAYDTLCDGPALTTERTPAHLPPPSVQQPVETPLASHSSPTVVITAEDYVMTTDTKVTQHWWQPFTCDDNHCRCHQSDTCLNTEELVNTSGEVWDDWRRCPQSPNRADESSLATTASAVKANRWQRHQNCLCTAPQVLFTPSAIRLSLTDHSRQWLSNRWIAIICCHFGVTWHQLFSVNHLCCEEVLIQWRIHWLPKH